MKKKTTKAFALVLALLMTAGLFGCNGTNTTPSSTANPVDNTTAAPTKKLADYEKVSSFNIFGIAAGVTDEQLNDSDTSKLLNTATGYNVKYVQQPADATDMETAITNVFMLKQDYQAVKVSKNEFYTLLAMDALAPITEYVNASTNLKEQISQFGWSTATKDGDIYGIPLKGAYVCNSVALCYRLDWLKEYNEKNPNKAIPLPSEQNGYSMSVSQFKTMLEYFKTKVPAGGYPMAVDTNCVYMENIMPAFGVYQEWADVNGKLTYVIDQPGFEDYAAYMKGLFDDGLIKYQATSDDAGAVKSLQSRTAGAGRIAHWNAFAIETTNVAKGTDTSTYTDDSIGYIMALVADKDAGDASKVRVVANDGYSYYTVIPKFTKPEQIAAVIDYADKKLDKDLFLKMVLGTEGETFSIKDGSYYPILPAFNDKQGLADKFLDGSREEDYAKYWLCRVRKTSAQAKMFFNSNFNIEKCSYHDATAVMPANEAFDTYYSNTNLQTKSEIVLNMFNKGVAFDINAIRAKWAAGNGDQITSSVNEWYSKWEYHTTYNTK